MHLHKRYVSALAGLLFALPVWAGHSNSVDWSVTQPTMIGGTEIKPGDYVIKVEDGGTQLQVIGNRKKVVAQLPCQWTQLPQKAGSSGVYLDGNAVTEVKFEGKTSAVTFAK